jgi:L,D-peptidoglycan transpeptidase YkuD (ErfK/YbiS/YcfS/YnhG family)
MRTKIPTLLVTADEGDARSGVAILNDCTRKFRCALGKGGVVRDKREGDGATPLGRFPLRQLLYRPDRETPPRTRLPLRALGPQDGWCDEPGAPAYNRMVSLPHGHRHERLWREDHVYDLILVVGYNDAPVISGYGSAIFIHLMREDYAPTEGCIAFAREDLLEILAALTPESMVVIEA